MGLRDFLKAAGETMKEIGAGLGESAAVAAWLTIDDQALLRHEIRSFVRGADQDRIDKVREHIEFHVRDATLHSDFGKRNKVLAIGEILEEEIANRSA